MRIRENLYFSYAGKYSYEYGLFNVNLDSGMMQDLFAAPRTINEVAIRGKDKPYFQGIDRHPLTFPVTFAIPEPEDFNKLESIAKWLCGQRYYKPLIFAPDIHRIYYAMFIDDSNVIYTSADSGYVTLNVRVNAPYAYSPMFVTKEHEFNEIKEIKINNIGQYPIYPEIFITMPGSYSAGFSVNNLTNENKGFSMSELSLNEELYINCEKQFINTSEDNTYRYNNMEGDFLELLPGYNKLKLQGSAEIYFKYQCKLI